MYYDENVIGDETASISDENVIGNETASTSLRAGSDSFWIFGSFILLVRTAAHFRLRICCCTAVAAIINKGRPLELTTKPRQLASGTGGITGRDQKGLLSRRWGREAPRERKFACPAVDPCLDDLTLASCTASISYSIGEGPTELNW